MMNSYHFMKPHRSANFLLANSSFIESKPSAVPVTESNQVSSINEKKIGEVWSKHNFDTNKVKLENIMILGNVKTTWGASSGEDETNKEEEPTFRQNVEGNEEERGQSKESKSKDPEEVPPQNIEQVQEETSPSHHARRPPNAFLIFCKKHRPIVREKYPTTENRGVTKILGEWWALLNLEEKQPYNDLAKEYKDAFLSANPDFRWYKLPAPPLRTLATRPTTIAKPPPPAAIASPPPTLLSEFTPGKLADESQLGGLTSLMNNNYSLSKKMDDSPCCQVEDNNNENPNTEMYQHDKIEDKIQEMFSSPTNITQRTLPPKPIKKRIFEQYDDEKSCSKNIFDDKNDITQQDLLNKVVDGIFASDKDDEPKEQRKSDRMCKGKRYERFMVEGKLLGNKRDTKLTQHHRTIRIESKIEHELYITKPSYDTPKFNLENTIKRLAERTNVKIAYDEDAKPKAERVRTGSETSEGNAAAAPAKSPPVNFNLDLRIDNLPSLNYKDFIVRKRERKKRKQKIRPDMLHSKMPRLENNNFVTSKPDVPVAVGSKKRKNKLSITHLNKPEEDDTKLTVPPQVAMEVDDRNEDSVSLDTSEDNVAVLPGDALLGLATLAMVAASTEKIGEKMVGT